MLEKEVQLELSNGEVATGSRFLVAGGRKLKIADIGRDNIGLQDGSFVPVDYTICVDPLSGGWLYAVSNTNMRAHESAAHTHWQIGNFLREP